MGDPAFSLGKVVTDSARPAARSQSGISEVQAPNPGEVTLSRPASTGAVSQGITEGRLDTYRGESGKASGLALAGSVGPLERPALKSLPGGFPMEDQMQVAARMGPQKMDAERKARVQKKVLDLQNGIAKSMNTSNGTKGRVGLLNPLYFASSIDHAQMMQKKPARDKIIGPPVYEKKPGDSSNIYGTPVGPQDFAAVHDDIIADKGVGKYMFGNCAEQASFMMAEMLKKIKDDPDFAGVKVQQLWVFKKDGGNHSYMQVYYPGEEDSPVVYDPWYVNQSGLMSMDTVKKYYPPSWTKDDKIIASEQFP